MAFKLGDFVRFLDEKREGYITRVIDDLTVGVTDTDGFEIPVAKSNLTHVHGQANEAAKANAVAEIVNDEFIETGVYVAVVEEGKNSAVAKLNILNKTSYQLLLTLKTDTKGKFRGEFAGVINPKTSTEIYTANLGELDLWPDFAFQTLFFTSANKEPKQPLLVTKKFKAKDLSVSKQQIADLNKYGWLIKLDEEPLKIDAQKLKESFHSSKADNKPKIQKPADEVDLHIEKLRDDHQFLSQSEILDIQLDVFKKALDAAIVHQMHSIVFIHGVGNGTLRHHIHKTISKHSQVRTFLDARKEKFGFGATEVVFKL